MSPLPILAIALAIVIAGVLVLRLHAFLTLIVAALVVSALTDVDGIGRRVAEGFGRTTLDVGIVIAMASILGGALMAARGAERIVAALRHLLGEKRAPLALLGSGFLLGIPMFAEGVFYLLLPLAKAMWAESRRHYVLCVLAIVAGATMTHSLVPPTPGPLFVAHALDVPIALMIQQGLIVAAAAALAGYAYATWAERRWGAHISPELPSVSAGLAAVHDTPLPPLWLSLLPIMLPVVLISAESSLGASPDHLPAWLVTTVRVLGDKNLALTCSAMAALGLVVRYAPAAGSSRRELVRTTVRNGVVEAGEIILIIGAGGALGAVLRQAGMADLAAAAMPEERLWLLPIAWAVTGLIRFAQGSATVAMITAAGIVGPMAVSGDVAYHPVYVAVAIGAGSKMGMWMNDSGFWVISRMSGMTEPQTLRTASVMVAIEGTAGLMATLVLAWLWPLR